MPSAAAVVCPGCRRNVLRRRWEEALCVCLYCGHHAPVPAGLRLAQLADPGTLERCPLEVPIYDPLGFDDGQPYPARVAAARRQTGEDEAMVVGRATIAGVPCVVAAMEFRFLGGSLGMGTGDLFLHACDLAMAEERALVAVCTSGGARMQEGVAALLQMARCSAGTSGLRRHRLPYVAVLADPCYGGVLASFAAQADVLLAEPGARIGFAGRRVVEEAAGETLPPDFQTAEAIVEWGMVDAVVPRHRLRATLGAVLRALTQAPVHSDGSPATTSPSSACPDPDVGPPPGQTAAVVRRRQRTRRIAAP